MFAKLLGILSGGSLIPWITLGVLAAMVGCFGAGVYLGHHYGWLQQEAAISSASQAVAETTERQALTTEQVGQAFASQQARTQIVIQTIVKKVPVYVTKQADAHCTIPLGFVRLHDAAAGGVPVLSDTSGQSHGTPGDPDAASGHSLSDVAETVTDNYGACRQIAEQLVDLQDWVSRQQVISTK